MNPRTSQQRLVWAGFTVVALLMLEVLAGAWYGIVIPLAATALAVALHGGLRVRHWWRSMVVDRHDLVMVAIFYLAIVALFRVAFIGFGAAHVAGLFLTFAAGLLLGVAGPIWYTVWRRDRPMASLGLGGPWRQAAVFGLILATVQFFLTLWRQPLPADAQDWAPLLVMSLTVGAFETVFFRGFAQRRLEATFGRPTGIAGAAALYAVYHVGYGMGTGELLFLFGLGVVYAIAFAVGEHVIVLWPLLTPLGAFYNNLRTGDIDLPWASIAGFADVIGLMVLAIWLGYRHQHRHARGATPASEGSKTPTIAAG
jgi:uncharacterized protein